MVVEQNGNDKKEAGSFKKLRRRQNSRAADKESLKEELP
jgi:hypothetical protein